MAPPTDPQLADRELADGELAGLRGSPPRRVRMEPVRFHHMLLDGIWWPGSGDLAAELRILVPALEQTSGPVARLLLAAAGWASRPHEVVTDGRSVSVGYLAGQSPSLMRVHLVDGRELTLIVRR